MRRMIGRDYDQNMDLGRISITWSATFSWGIININARSFLVKLEEFRKTHDCQRSLDATIVIANSEDEDCGDVVLCWSVI